MFLWQLQSESHELLNDDFETALFMLLQFFQTCMLQSIQWIKSERLRLTSKNKLLIINVDDKTHLFFPILIKNDFFG